MVVFLFNTEIYVFYCYVYVFLLYVYISSSCQLALFGYPDRNVVMRRVPVFPLDKLVRSLSRRVISFPLIHPENIRNMLLPILGSLDVINEVN